MMSNSLKIGVVAIAVIIVGALVYFGQSHAPQTTTIYTQPTNEAVTPPPAASAQNTPAGTASGTTNAQLDQSLSGIDSQMSGLNTDSANVDAGMNDKPIPQAQ